MLLRSRIVGGIVIEADACCVILEMNGKYVKANMIQNTCCTGWLGGGRGNLGVGLRVGKVSIDVIASRTSHPNQDVRCTIMNVNL